MSTKNPVAFVPEAYNPDAYNPNAYNMIVYSRPQNHSELMFFPRRPQAGLSTLEDIASSSGGQEIQGAGELGGQQFGAAFTAKAMTAESRSEPGAVVAFLEGCYPMAVMFNTATGAWTSAQAQAAIAAADRTNVFRALEGLPGQTEVPVVVESAKALGDAIGKVASSAGRALVQSSVAPMCADMRLVDVSRSPAVPVDIYEAATKTSPDHLLIVAPFLGQKDSKPEICCDGILANGELVFSAFSEKARVASEPPYEDLRIVTSDDLDPGVREAARDVAAQLAAKLGVRNCVFHAEFWVTGNGPQLSDFMTRPGGGLIPEMVKAKWGVDLRAAHVYASFAMADELARIAREAKTAPEQVAIGSLYSAPGKTAMMLGNDERATLAEDKRVIAYSVVSEFSNSAVGSNDSRGALCVRGGDSAGAVAALDDIAARFGLV
ncbi:hypothetical protein ACQKOH_17240 [Sphingomonas sp. NPDC092331]|jgi:hypothetical protein|uniref:hypothetical protein n=2 Tax=Sphingomonas TaxID=13687 RepID=UPI0038203204